MRAVVVDRRRRRMSDALLALGYTLAWGAGAKLVPMYRQRRRSRFLVLEAGTACVVAGLVVRRRPLPAAVNAAALVGFAVAGVATG
jgi:hypothetical protein